MAVSYLGMNARKRANRPANAFIGGDTNKYSILVRKFLVRAPLISSLSWSVCVVHGGSQSSQVTYTAQGQTPTGWQNLYAIKEANKPIALTVPHSGATPEGANMNAFGVNEQGQFTFNGQHTFGVQGENDALKVYYLGAGDGQYQKTPLTVKECKGC